MRLDYSMIENMYLGSPGTTKEMVDTIRAREECKSLLVKNALDNRMEKHKVKLEAINNLIYEKNLIEEDICNVIREDLAGCSYNLFRFFNASLLSDAWRYSRFKNEFEDEEEKNKCKNSYEFVITQIKRNILREDNDFELIAIVEYNYGDRYEFEYTYKGQEITVSIPNYGIAKPKNYIDLLQGTILRYHESECVIGNLAHDLNYEKIAEELKKWKEKVKAQHWKSERRAKAASKEIRK